MSNSVVSFVPEQARQAHRDLIDALGTEHCDGQWMLFMEAVERWIPESVFRSAGRPTKEEVFRSPIGLLGFTSWRALVTTEQESGGLGLPWSRWKEYRRAWAVVREQPWLRNENMTASAVRQLADRVRAAEVEFPRTGDELEQFEQERQEAAEQRRSESLSALKAENEELHQRIQDLRSSYEKTDAVATERKEQIERLQSQINESNQILSKVEDAAKKWKDKAEKSRKEAAEQQARADRLDRQLNRSIIQRIKDWFK